MIHLKDTKQGFPSAKNAFISEVFLIYKTPFRWNWNISLLTEVALA